MNVGETIKRKRKELGLSAEIIAKKAGLSPATIYRYESGEIKSPRSSVLRPIANALGLDLTELVGEDKSFEGAHSPAESELIALYRAADERGRRYILESARIASGIAP